ncbi:MAG: hypothetical protein R2710_13945 [Acidimicrobiales bacterium]
MPEAQEDHNTSANSLIDKLRDFAGTLNAEERQLLAALLAPGVNAAWEEPAEVSGFSAEWSADQLPSHLSDAIRGRSLRVEGW